MKRSQIYVPIGFFLPLYILICWEDSEPYLIRIIEENKLASLSLAPSKESGLIFQGYILFMTLP